SGMFTEYGGGVSLPAYSNFAAGTSGTYALALLDIAGVDSYVIGRMNADGYPDTSFGGIGIKFLAQSPPTDFAIPADAFYWYSRIGEADDGSIVISSAVDNGTLILKVNPSTGQPVDTFGNNGYVYLEGTAASQLLATDAVYVASQVNLNPGTYMSVSKIDLTTGDLDSGFGSGGTLNLSVGATSADEWESLTSPMIALSDGSILLSGYVDAVVGQGGGFGASGYAYENWFVKMNPDGSLDTDFGTDGYLLLNNGTGYEHPQSVIQASDGDIWALSVTDQNFLEFEAGLDKNYAELNRFDLSGDLVTRVGLTTDADPTTNQVSEAGSDGDLAGITAAAPDSDGDTVSYTLSDDGGGRFAIDSLTGTISVADVSLLDYSQDESHTVTVQSTSADG
ncbi:hypothetical protein, partial [Shewanella sp.]|uniref:hypothetical protein n=1 Tax=Shewanella sp. TaxID=50422 RepID=UPI0040471ADA